VPAAGSQEPSGRFAGDPSARIGNGIPQVAPARDALKSSSPCRMKPSISFFRYSGSTQSGCSRKYRSRGSWYFERRKNQFRSVSHWSSTFGWFAQWVPAASSTSCVRGMNPSFGQYQPS
jgi:hypothetical protein